MLQTRPRAGFTLIELMIGACVLTIVLGLAVSLSRHVRGQSARVLTSDLLARLEKVLDNYTALNGPSALPTVTPVMSSPGVSEHNDYAEEAIFRAALRNNRDFLLALKRYGEVELFSELPPGIYDPTEPGLRDAWGTPVVLITPASNLAQFVRTGHPATTRIAGGPTGLGSSPRGGNTAFFVSAGPDRRFLTRVDNLYSYESFRQPQ